MLRKPAILGLIVVAFLWTWQFLTVHYNYGGNWTALFCIRPGMPVPDFLKSEKLYIFEGTEGYDGQVYHLIAHDPWMRKGSAEAIAGAAFRYQRILVPALAWIVAFGQDRWIHASYFAVILGFGFLGVYWLGLLAMKIGRSPLWGIVFALAPATIVSIDRMTADIALAAFAVGFALFAEPSWKTFALLACAALTRETALPIIAGYALYLCSRKQFINGGLAAASALPAAAWYVYLTRREPSPVRDYVDWAPLAGWIDRVIHPTIYALPPLKAFLGIALDYVALAGVAMTLFLAAVLAVKRRWTPQSAAVYALAVAAIFLRSRSVWEDVYAFGRVLTPFLLLTGLEYFAASPWLAFAPMFLVDTRISLNLVAQVTGIFRGVIG
jgi:hypothetical protein